MRASLRSVLPLTLLLLAADGVMAQEPAPAATPAPVATPPPSGAAAEPAPAEKKAEAEGDKPAPSDDESVAAGVGNRFLQTETPMTNDKGIFEARIQHRFYQSANEAGGGSAFGLDGGANVTLTMDYVLVRNLSIMVARSSSLADYEFGLKFTAHRPTRGFPIGIGIRGGLNWITAGYIDKQSSAFGQLLLTAHFGNAVTIGAAPSWAQRTPTEESVVNVPITAQVMITRSTALMAEYIPKKWGEPSGTIGQWSAGIEKSVYHHKFALWVGNSGATTVDQMLAGDYNFSTVHDNNIRIGFHIVRLFDIAVD